ncbi:hypothetical protein T4A_9678 [Trichinella pseudospiralis]|uniref:Uncharacterized protein n=2 Tax=Trichinella pseudospiralis TaxID=6337 RepID=A0A0V1EW77_TRIPS|nr:hypothetical protein T4A_9678 [Trichinella pseudospiralis]
MGKSFKSICNWFSKLITCCCKSGKNANPQTPQVSPPVEPPDELKEEMKKMAGDIKHGILIDPKNPDYVTFRVPSEIFDYEDENKFEKKIEKMNQKKDERESEIKDEKKSEVKNEKKDENQELKM